MLIPHSFINDNQEHMMLPIAFLFRIVQSRDLVSIPPVDHTLSVLRLLDHFSSDIRGSFILCLDSIDFGVLRKHHEPG